VLTTEGADQFLALLTEIVHQTPGPR
jgi:hypothetical protein